jgi:adenylate cyclase
MSLNRNINPRMAQSSETSLVRTDKHLRILGIFTAVFILAVLSKAPLCLNHWETASPIFFMLLITASLAAITWIWTHFKKLHQGLIWLFVVGWLHLSLSSLFVGVEQGLHYYLLAVISSLVLVVPLGWRRTGLLLVTLNTMSYLGLSLWFTNHGPLLDLPKDFVDQAKFSNAIGLFLASVANSYFAMRFYLEDRKKLALEQERSESLLHSVIPPEIARRLQAEDHSGQMLADYYSSVSVVFADIVNFTAKAEKMESRDVVLFLDQIFGIMDQAADQFKLEKIKTIGDSYMAVGGLQAPDTNHIDQVIDFALYAKAELAKHFPDVQMRFGIDTGPVVAGVIGNRKFIYDLWGDCVNTASRMESHGTPDQIQVTAKVLKLSKKHAFVSQGSMEIKGKGLMEVWWVQKPTQISG